MESRGPPCRKRSRTKAAAESVHPHIRCHPRRGRRAGARRIGTRSAQVLDARPAERFRGEAPEPRPGLRAGHIPGSINLPFATIIENGKLKDKASIERAVTEAGIDLERPVITSCGSGVSAAILSLGLEMVGHPAAALYDGSWAEWGSATTCRLRREMAQQTDLEVFETPFAVP